MVGVFTGIDPEDRKAMLGCKDESIHKFLYKALFAIGMDDWGMAELQPIVLEVCEQMRLCMHPRPPLTRGLSAE